MTTCTGACMDSASLCKTWQHVPQTFLWWQDSLLFSLFKGPQKCLVGLRSGDWKRKSMTVRTPRSLLFFSLQSSEVRLGSICCFSMNPSPQRYEPQGVAYLWGMEWYRSSPGSEWSQFCAGISVPPSCLTVGLRHCAIILFSVCLLTSILLLLTQISNLDLSTMKFCYSFTHLRCLIPLLRSGLETATRSPFAFCWLEFWVTEMSICGEVAFPSLNELRLMHWSSDGAVSLGLPDCALDTTDPISFLLLIITRYTWCYSIFSMWSQTSGPHCKMKHKTKLSPS